MLFRSVRLWTDEIEKDGEDTDAIVMDTARKLNVPLDEKQIGRSHRVGRRVPGKPRAIIVKFTSYNMRRKFYQARKRTTGSGVFISEDLTKRRSNIMYIARGLKRDNLIHSCWTTDGRMYVRERNPLGANADQGPVVQIMDKTDLDVYMR